MIRGRLVCLAKRICWFWNMRFAQGCETKNFHARFAPERASCENGFFVIVHSWNLHALVALCSTQFDLIGFGSSPSCLTCFSCRLYCATLPGFVFHYIFTTVPYPALHSNNNYVFCHFCLFPTALFFAPVCSILLCPAVFRFAPLRSIHNFAFQFIVSRCVALRFAIFCVFRRSRL